MSRPRVVGTVSIVLVCGSGSLVLRNWRVQISTLFAFISWEWHETDSEEGV